MIALDTSFDCKWGMESTLVFLLFLLIDFSDINDLAEMEKQLFSQWDSLTLKDAQDYSAKLEQLQITHIGTKTGEYPLDFIEWDCLFDFFLYIWQL